MGLMTGGVSLVAGAIEQLQYEGDGIVSASQRDHNIVVATRNGVILGFLTGYLWAVDVPGSKPPQFAGNKAQQSPSPIRLGYNAAEGRWEVAYTTRF